MDGDDGVAVVVLAAEHLLDLGGLNLRSQLIEGGPEVLENPLTLRGPLDEDLEIIASLPERRGQLMVFLQPSTAL